MKIFTVQRVIGYNLLIYVGSPEREALSVKSMKIFPVNTRITSLASSNLRKSPIPFYSNNKFIFFLSTEKILRTEKSRCDLGAE
jgi:hypothetical protein